MNHFIEDDGELSSVDGLYCPFCEYEQMDLFEITGAYEEGEHSRTCGGCQKEFNFSVYIEYTWTSTKPPEELEND